MLEKILKLGFFLLYNHFAFLYDIIAWIVSLGQWSKWRQTVLPHLYPGITLELAHGTGGLITTMLLQGIKVVGIDLSPFMSHITANRLAYHQLLAPISQAQAQHLPFPTGYFNNVIATFPTNYIFHPETLAEIHRVLSDNPTANQLIIVLQGELRGPQSLTLFIEFLYQITGQKSTPHHKLLDIFTQAGFEARLETAEFNNASAGLVICTKTAQ